MYKFKEGDTVRLKSGGPVMTIDSIIEDDNEIVCTCKWFDDKGDLKIENFLDNNLELAEASKARIRTLG